jgi:hypothetical protein
VYLFDHDGQRWFTDSYSMVPVRCVPAGFPTKSGYWRLEDDPDDEEGWGTQDYRMVKEDWDSRVATDLWKRVSPRTVDRTDAQLFMWPLDRDPSVIVYEQCAGVMLNRLYLEAAAAIAERPIDGYGISGPLDVVTLYGGDELVGYMMPVRSDRFGTAHPLIPLVVS